MICLNLERSAIMPSLTAVGSLGNLLVFSLSERNKRPQWSFSSPGYSGTGCSHFSGNTAFHGLRAETLVSIIIQNTCECEFSLSKSSEHAVVDRGGRNSEPYKVKCLPSLACIFEVAYFAFYGLDSRDSTGEICFPLLQVSCSFCSV